LYHRLECRSARTLCVGVGVPEAASAACILVMIAVSLLWNGWAGIFWHPALGPIVAGPVVLLLLSLIYTAIRPVPVIAEIVFYLALWSLFPIFAVRLTYLCYTIGYPLADAALSQADAALGFHWRDWAVFVQAHPLFDLAQRVSYASYWWQPFALILTAAISRPRQRNAEIFTALSLALLLTLIITSFLPAIGPAEAFGLHPEPAPVVHALYAGARGQTLPYAGIVSFPSFHTVMAVLFAYGCRGLRWLFPVAIAFNALMVVSVPLCGDHYLVDVLAGAAVAAVSIGATGRLARLCGRQPTLRGARRIRV